MFKRLLNRVGCDSHLTQTLGRCLTLKGYVGSAMVVRVFPVAQLLSETRRAAEDRAAVELVRVCPVAAFHLFVAFRAALQDLPVRDAEIPQVSCEVSAKLGAVISLNPLDGDGKPATNLLDEISGRLDGIMGVDAEDAIPGGFIDRRELVES